MSSTAISGDLREKVRQIVLDVLEIDTAELTEESSFIDDFGADSLLVIEMFARFERQLGIRIPKDEMTDLPDLPAAYAIAEKYSEPSHV
ncbi:acyl carrier protein [Amycolatopsis sp. NPDC051128]|uniref:acyl carrier protein n=1 Tax=Amycolatopsis sp. NPDC051128 TaxID=3155412 RepID=UPI003429FA19